MARTGLTLSFTRNGVWNVLSYIRSLEAGRQPSQGEIRVVSLYLAQMIDFLEATHGSKQGPAVPAYAPSKEGLG